jgi:hypothetical protein
MRQDRQDAKGAKQNMETICQNHGNQSIARKSRQTEERLAPFSSWRLVDLGANLHAGHHRGCAVFHAKSTPKKMCIEVRRSGLG